MFIKRANALLLTIILIVFSILSPAISRGQLEPTEEPIGSGQTPGNLLVGVRKAVLGLAPGVNWKADLDPYYRSWQTGCTNCGGSQNLPLIAAVIGLFKEPYQVMQDPRTLAPNTNRVTHIEWLYNLLATQSGSDLYPLSQGKVPATLRYFKGTETFSNTYDAPVVSAILAVRYWAQLNGHGYLASAARQYLRATWAAYGLAAGSSHSDKYLIPGRTPVDYYDPISCGTFSGGICYDGPFLALAGARSTRGHMGYADDRMPLFGRACEWAYTRSKEASHQKDLMAVLVQRWSAFTTNETLYGLVKNDEPKKLRDLALYGHNWSEIKEWLNGIRTSTTFRLLGWTVNGSQVRASMMEENMNWFTACVYAVAYYGSNKDAYFLYPWRDTGRSAGTGWCRLGSDNITASNEGSTTQPIKVVSMPIPAQNPIFNIVLSRNAEKYVDTTPSWMFPPGPAPVYDSPRNPEMLIQ
ncbi:MAG TPA: hypothetical protein VJQ56_09400 [Blastocatellia bacterium]|nr:hypothetical protein [Blastocatellia bacterium]